MATFRKVLKEWAPVLVLMLIAGVLRFYELGAWPPGLYHDEAYNGLDALRVLAGDRPLYFPANHGREPFFIYLVSLSVGWLGRSAYAVRLPAAISGTLLIPAAYFMARELFGRRAGLLTAAITTITLWPHQDRARPHDHGPVGRAIAAAVLAPQPDSGHQGHTRRVPEPAGRRRDEQLPQLGARRGIRETDRAVRAPALQTGG